ncbi:MAG: Lrp/AsnC family transcriptional regulator [Steroidobacter sp.]
MATSKRKPTGLDQVDWTLLEELQADARQTHSSLARKVNLSPPAVAERIARLERAGVIRGYYTGVDATQLGWPIEAIVHFRRPRGAHENAVAAITAIPEVIECHRVTGPQFLVLKIRAASTRHLERVLKALALHGESETAVILSTTLSHRPVRPPADKD